MIAKLQEKANGFGGDERAVSPVVGVALLIAITVVLAAVIGFVVLNTSNQTADLPSARLDVSGGGGDAELSVVHDGGDGILADNIEVVVADDTGGTNRADLTDGSVAEGTELTTGDEIPLSASDFDDFGSDTDGDWESGDTVRIVWNDPDSDRKSQLASFTVG